MAVLGVGKQAGRGIDHSVRFEGLIAGCVDSFGLKDAYMRSWACEGTAAGQMYMVAEQVSVPGGNKLVFHNWRDDKEHQQLFVEVGKEQELCLVVVAWGWKAVGRVSGQNHSIDVAQLEGQIGKGRTDFRTERSYYDEDWEPVQPVSWKPSSLQQL
jgi:hypothetical protein